MKCPKCGYNSFEYHDVCKKCSNDLAGYKVTYGLKAIVLPQAARTTLAAALMAETAAHSQSTEIVAEAATDMFSFDLPDEEVSAVTATNSENPFDFDEEPAADEPKGFGEFSFDEAQKSAQSKAEEDAFANLLESSSQDAETTAVSAPAAAAKKSDEFDLNNFSWDDTPAAPTTTEAKPEDDFNSLFGDMDEVAKK